MIRAPNKLRRIKPARPNPMPLGLGYSQPKATRVGLPEGAEKRATDFQSTQVKQLQDWAVNSIKRPCYVKLNIVAGFGK
ncbi:hypothetical protein GJ744_005961 [Endocarpon pusillum]|uniref:Uncharacterized protein n=1 Tax=Endocarpon pusillum TaxID=364733 RepID=A0A8H7A4E9_9EURO|nr:hypothetical protein GJ744_005961 [Endocarpon pusillum]